MRFLGRTIAASRIWSDLARVLCLALVSLALGLGANAVHPRGLPLVLGEFGRPGVPAWVWEEVHFTDVHTAWEKSAEGGTYLLDVRDSKDYVKSHARRAVNLPYREFDAQFPAFRARFGPDTRLYVYCYGAECGLAVRVANRLIQAGYTNVIAVKGGWAAWVTEKLPVEGTP